MITKVFQSHNRLAIQKLWLVQRVLDYHTLFKASLRLQMDNG